MVKRVHIVISGNVQGVFFRYNTKRLALSLGLKGFARNLPNGNVEVVAEGTEEAIKELIEFCKKGPTGADVEDIKVEYEEIKKEFDGFYSY
jgi:acylphosphatase